MTTHKYKLEFFFQSLSKILPRNFGESLTPELLNEKETKVKCSRWYIISKIYRNMLEDLSYLPNPSARAGYDTRSIFKRSLIQSFPSPRLMAALRLKNQSVLLFTHSWRENNWIHTFPKGISAMWNANSLVQDLNSCRRVHFQRR